MQALFVYGFCWLASLVFIIEMQDTWPSVSTTEKTVVNCFFSKEGQHGRSNTWKKIAHLAWEIWLQCMNTPFSHCPQIIKWLCVSLGCGIIRTIKEWHLGRELALQPVISQFAMALPLSGSKQCMWIKHNIFVPLFCSLFPPNFHLFGIKINTNNKQNTKWERSILSFWRTL